MPISAGYVHASSSALTKCSPQGSPASKVTRQAKPKTACLNPTNRTARAEQGVTWREFKRAVSIDRPGAGSDHFQQVPVRIAEIEAAAARLPGTLFFQCNALFLQP